jgi:hypothetical protein
VAMRIHNVTPEYISDLRNWHAEPEHRSTGEHPHRRHKLTVICAAIETLQHMGAITSNGCRRLQLVDIALNAKV